MNSKAFTLLETLLVVIILIILCGIVALPRLKELYAKVQQSTLVSNTDALQTAQQDMCITNLSSWQTNTTTIENNNESTTENESN